MSKRPNRAWSEDREAATSCGLAPPTQTSDWQVLQTLGGPVADGMIYKLAKYMASSAFPPLPFSYFCLQSF